MYLDTSTYLTVVGTQTLTHKHTDIHCTKTNKQANTKMSHKQTHSIHTNRHTDTDTHRHSDTHILTHTFAFTSTRLKEYKSRIQNLDICSN